MFISESNHFWFCRFYLFLLGLPMEYRCLERLRVPRMLPENATNTEEGGARPSAPSFLWTLEPGPGCLLLPPLSRASLRTSARAQEDRPGAGGGLVKGRELHAGTWQG